MTTRVTQTTCPYLLINAISLAFLLLSVPAGAETPPRGSYQQSCRSVSMNGTTLNASCLARPKAGIGARRHSQM